jgi:DNA-binding transcriptional MerR regulator
MYKIKEIAEIAGISTRTLRHYHSIGLLIPSKIDINGYRLYSNKDVDKLQQILIYKRLSFDLFEIKELLQQGNVVDRLQKQKKQLYQKKKNLEQLISTVENTIQYHKGETNMTENEKFRGIKEQLIDQNEMLYGTEIRNKYGDDLVNASYQKIRKMSKWQLQRAEELRLSIHNQINKVREANDVKGIEGKRLVEMHQEWIKLYWDNYTIQSHLGLASMYLQDDRFTSYYDKYGHGSTQCLVDSLYYHLKKDHEK